MEGPLDPQHPSQDAGASQPEAQDAVHTLLERLLGQGDVRPSPPGAGQDLWPDMFGTAPPADEASTIVPALEAPSAVAEILPVEEQAVASLEPEAFRAWEPFVVDSASATTNVDDIHAAILASVSVELQPIAPAVGADAARQEPVPGEPVPADAVHTDPDDTEPGPMEPLGIAGEAGFDFVGQLERELAGPMSVEPELPATVADEPEPVSLHYITEAFSGTLADSAAEDVVEAASDVMTVDEVVYVAPDVEAMTIDLTLDEVSAPVQTAAAVSSVVEDAAPSFALTPFDAGSVTAPTDFHPDADAPWAAAVPELGLDDAPLLDLEPFDVAPDDEPVAPTAVVLPWPSYDSKGVEPAPPSAYDLIEAALSGLHADLTAEPVEPLRTPDVAVSTAHVVFRLGARTMAIPMSAVSEIARPPKVTRLPHVPAWVLGIANLRGDIVSMLDLEGFMSGKLGRSSHEQRMLALRPAGDEVRTAVLVDGVDGIHAFEDGRVTRLTRGFDAAVAPYARGLYQWEDDLVVVLDAERLLESKPMRQFEDGAAAR